MRIPKDSFLVTTPIAHRGLHDAEQNIPENSCAAFARAMQEGYAAETDVRLTRDGKLILFHDDDLFRMTGEKGKTDDMTADELSALASAGQTSAYPALPNFWNLSAEKFPCSSN